MNIKLNEMKMVWYDVCKLELGGHWPHEIIYENGTHRLLANRNCIVPVPVRYIVEHSLAAAPC